MIFGDIYRFAIEFDLDQDYCGTWLYGKFCFWLKGERIGDYDLGTSLRDILILIECIVRDNGKRTHQELFDLDTLEVYERLNTALYSGPPIYEEIALEETWARFDVSLSIDIFNGWKMFLVENEETARVIVNYFHQIEDKSNTYEVLLRKGEFDKVIFKAYEELGKLYDTEKAKEQ